MEQFRIDVLPIRDATKTFRAVYGRSDRNGACPTRSFTAWPEVEEHLRSLGFVDWAIREGNKEVCGGKTYTFRTNWHDEFETFWRA